MIRPKTMLATLACLPLALAGCSSSDEAGVATEATVTSTTTDGATGSLPGGGRSGDEQPEGSSSDAGSERDTVVDDPGRGSPCDAVSPDLLGGAFPDVTFEAPETGQGQRGIGDTIWQTVTCRWESDVMRVRAAVAGPEGFEGGFVCAVPTRGVSKDEPVEVEDLGDRAWWTWDDFNGFDANLAVCAGELRVDIDVDAPDGVEIDPVATRDGATAIVRALI